MFGWFRKTKASKASDEKPAGAGSGRAAINDRVRAALAAEGDDGTRIRHVIHFAYPLEGGGHDQQAARDLVVWTGCEFTETDDSSGIVFEHMREVASDDFDRATERLARDLASIGWTYDGWECAVVTGKEDET